ncbi:MAG: Hpt domain-containing protein [Bacteroidota bacterium]|nr:Hpt domain-containing protein [Bacteroidota bacterium]
MVEQKLYNASRLEEMTDGDTKFAKEMIEYFINIYEEVIQNLFYYYEKEDWNMLRRTAHKFLSNASMLGAFSIVGNIDEIEDLALQKKKNDNIPELINTVNKDCKILSIQFENDFLKDNN